jgi:hypothetical protein
VRPAVLLAIALAGCPSTSLSNSDEFVINATRQAWNAVDDLPAAHGACHNIDVVRHASKRAYVDACLGVRSDAYREAAENSAGCTTTSLRGVTGETWYTLRIAPGYSDDPTLVVHEMLHALTDCTGSGPNTDPFDAGHRDVRVWKAVGGAPSVQAVAESLLRDD